jgi:hypothetical protein
MDVGPTRKLNVLLLAHTLIQVSYYLNEVIKVGVLYSYNSKESTVRLNPILAKKMTKIQIVVS